MTLNNPDLSMSAGARAAGVSVQTFWRWALYGIRGGHKVETWLRGGRRYTNREAIERFNQRLNAGTSSFIATVPGDSSPAVLRAEAELAAEGI